MTLSEQVDAAKMRAKMAIENTDDPMALLRVEYFLKDLWRLHQECPLLLQGRIETIVKGLTRELESKATKMVSVSKEIVPIAVQIAIPTQDMSLPGATCY